MLDGFLTQGTNITDSNMKVVRLLRKRLRSDIMGREYRQRRHRLYREAIEEHQKNKELYYFVMG